MTNLFFTSDHHFFHRLLQRQRGFASVEEMNEVMIERWNSVVKSGDRVYHLGDVSLGKPEETAEILSRLNGQIYLVLGNHDDVVETPKCRDRFVWIRHAEYLRVGEQKLYLHHYACRTWRSSHHGAWHLYGHSHGSLPEIDTSRSFDVGVDCWNLTPVSYEQVAVKMAMKKFEPVDHHREERD